MNTAIADAMAVAFFEFKEEIMKAITITLVFAVLILFSSGTQADNLREKALHDMHMIMQFMDHGLCVALKGANLQMLGQMNISEKMTKDTLIHSTIMIKDGIPLRV